MQPPSDVQNKDGKTGPEQDRPLVRALSDKAYHRFQRGVWAVCIAVYLIVFIGGVHAGGADLLAVGRAAAFTLVAALLGRTALGLLGHATAPGKPVPMAVPEGKVGSLADLLGTTNVPQQEQAKEDEAVAA